jgi:hypothetical protein
MATRKPTLLCALIAAAFIPLAAQADADTLAGNVRAYRIAREAAATGPLAQANALQPGTAAVDASTNTLQAELRGDTTVAGVALHAGATVDMQELDGTGTDSHGRVNEAYAGGSLGSWQWSAGKKVVSWDVGYGFRPNDVVQQETRRTLAAEPLEGRPLLMAERFDADSAWSLVWVNPTQDHDASGANEAALAARWYTRSGAVDWHALARQGEHTGASLGAAVSCVASDALELHASVRAYQHADSLTNATSGSAPTTANPWRTTQLDGGGQWLVGGTWTNASQVSLLLEAWHDDTALSDAQWDAWRNRNQGLPQWLSRGVPAAAVAGNLAWQASAFGAASNLRQDNLFARLSWQHERWQSALDLLYTPADQGLTTTASVVWTGEHIKWEAGLRNTSGPNAAVVRQLPVQRQGCVVATWAF